MGIALHGGLRILPSYYRVSMRACRADLIRTSCLLTLFSINIYKKDKNVEPGIADLTGVLTDMIWELSI